MGNGPPLQVMVAIPTSGWLHSYVVQAMLTKILPTPGVKIHITISTHRPIENNRNRICIGFLRSNANWLLMMDDDNPPMCNPLELITLDLDIVGCPTPTNRNGKIAWNVYRHDSSGQFQSHRMGSGLEQVDAVGTGCILLSRRVIAALRQRPPFASQYDRYGALMLGSDLAFCVQAKELGFKVHTHWDYPCAHVCEANLYEIERKNDQAG